jgi:hypothetical protein
MMFLSLLLIFLQDQVPLKVSREFEVAAKYELKKKPAPDTPLIVLDQNVERRSSDHDLLPYLTVNLKIKRWAGGVTQIRIIDIQGKTYLKKKPSEEGTYSLDMGFVDDMKDKVAPAKFFVTFLKEKKAIEQITIEVEPDGTFLVNGEKRGKF